MVRHKTTSAARKSVKTNPFLVLSPPSFSVVIVSTEVGDAVSEVLAMMWISVRLMVGSTEGIVEGDGVGGMDIGDKVGLAVGVCKSLRSVRSGVGCDRLSISSGDSVTCKHGSEVLRSSGYSGFSGLG